MTATAENLSPNESRTSHSLGELLAMDTTKLADLYRGATSPRIADLSGDLRGRMLAVCGLGAPLSDLVRHAAASDRFPWRGKSFTPLSEDRGEGRNRVLSDRWKLFRFETFVGPSRAGAFDAVHLDYDHASNPFFIRAIKDEIRELEPGLYLGQAYVQIGAEPKLVLYFGLASASLE
ncbi:MAG: hypothetical protein HY698_16360 [Deltaproteobacteria bacterium]|nr:hypothetical protein [Deltaproteobacteria bacterium]